MAVTRPQLDKAIDTFLNHRRRSSTGGGWADVRPEDIAQLHDIIAKLLDLKMERDADGDLSINWLLIDRTKYESFHQWPLPYHTRENIDDVIESCISNLGEVTGRLNSLLKLRQLYKKEGEKK